MELALYCPVYGYYEKEEDTIGRRGDYYTSVSVGNLFGELLGFQFAEWLGRDEAGAGTVQIIEAGAHRGELARDILDWMRCQRPEILERLAYWVIEPSERRKEWQRQALAGFAGKVHWAKGLSELAAGPAGERSATRQVIFANELLDAFPVHRLGWDAKARSWFEWGVALEEKSFVWTRLTGGPFDLTELSLLPTLTPQLLALLPDHFTIEVCPAAEEWWRLAAGLLRAGKLVTLDYGFTAEELLAPERSKGTLRAYHDHQLSGDVLAHPGEQDITAHVNFTAIQAAGEAARLHTKAFVRQEQFLTRIAARAWEPGASFGEWTTQRTRQFQTLTHPEHLGRAFRVLVQERDDSNS